MNTTLQRVANAPFATSAAALDTRLEDRSPQRIHTVNLHHLVLALRDPEFAETILNADVRTADGWPVRWLISMFGQVGERVTGSEFALRVTEGHTRFRRIALIGASPEVGDAYVVQSHSYGVDVDVVMREHGRHRDWDAGELAERVRSAGADLVMVAVTPPRGDLVAKALVTAGITCPVISVGGSIDMIAGETRLAPPWTRRAGLEWLYRLAQEPRRLARRYLECLWVMGIYVIPTGLRARSAGARKPDA